MQTDEVGAAIDRIVEQEFWPWWFALAYVQPRVVRPIMLRGAVETFLACSGSEYAQGAAIRRVAEIVADDANLDAAAERTFIDEFQERLTKPILADRLRVWGRPDRNAVLHQTRASDWVGAEVLTYKTSDLIKVGWLTADPFAPNATKDPITYYFDLHLRGADVVAVAHDIDREWPSDDVGRDYADFLEIEREAGPLREGFWSPFVACAWVCSRSDLFAAAAQEYETRYLTGKRSEALGIASAAAWMVVGNLAGERYGLTFLQGLEAIRDAIGAKRLAAGTGERMGLSDRRPIEAHEWGAMRLAFERDGVSPLQGLCAVQWSSADLLAAFPTDAAQDLHKEVAPAGPVVPSIARPPMRLADAPPAVREWLALAVERKLPVRRAYRDAREKLGSGVLRQQEAQDLLKEAMAGHNLPVSRGRPHGRKTGSIR
jgi:hypothetical protein